MIDALAVVSATVLGLFAGSLLTEALLLVPYFKSLSFADFNKLHHDFGPRLYRYYAPLTISATILPVINAASMVLDGRRDVALPLAAAALVLVVLSTYFLYFRQANRAFAEKRLGEDELGGELTRWERVHAFRTAIAILAFVVSILALLPSDGGG